MKKVVLKISGMHCTSCAFNIDGEVEDTQGVTRASTNYAKQQTEVEFDDSVIELSVIQRVISDLGYSSIVLS